MNGKQPQALRTYDPDRGHRAIYITFGELWNWCMAITAATQEGDQYHDARALIEGAMANIATFFDGSLGTYIDPMTGDEKAYPEICDVQDIKDIYCDDYNCLLNVWPLFYSACNYVEDNNFAWYEVLKHFVSRVNRFCKFNKIRYTKLLQTMMLQYDPIADFDIREEKQQTYGDEEVNHTPVSLSGQSRNTNRPAATSQTQTANNPRTDHYTTTYDDASTARLESYDTQSGSVQTQTGITADGTNNTTFNSETYTDTRTKETDGYTLHRWGNQGNQLPQDMVVKEYDIAELWNLVKIFTQDLNKEVFLQVWWTP